MAAGEGTRVRLLSRRTVGDYNPAWAPDGSRIAFGRVERALRAVRALA